MSSDDGSTQQSVVKGAWSAEEDALLLKAIEANGTRKWSVLASHLPGRTGKQCRERWHNQLDNKLTKDGWSVSKNPMQHTQWFSLALTLRLLGCGRRRRTGSCSRGR